MAAESRLRRSARVFLFDPAGDVLLIRIVAPLEDGPFVFWVTPGGEMESGEGARDAAERELFEELGLSLIHIFSAIQPSPKFARCGPIQQADGFVF